MNDIKIIAFDLDGTLVRKDGSISNNTIEAFKKLKNKGIKLIPTTGRTIHSVIEIFKKLGIYEEGNLGIFNTGSVIQELITSKIIYEKCLNMNDYKIIRENVSSDYDVSVYTPDYIYVSGEVSKEVLFDNEILGMEIKKINLLENLNISRINIMGSKELLDKFCSQEHKFLSPYYTVRNIDISYEILNKDSSKGNAVEYLSKLYGVSLDNIMCIGDGNNDISMLNKVKYSVAMGNASNKVKENSKFITDDVENDGFVKALIDFKLI